MISQKVDYTVDDWIELWDAVMALKDDHLYDEDIMADFREIHEPIFIKSLVYIKAQLGIRTEPIISSSILSGNTYLINIWTEGENGLIIAHSKRVATEEEIEKYDRHI